MHFSKHLPVQSLKKKYQNKVLTMFKVNNYEYIRATSMKLFWCLYCCYFLYSGVFIVHTYFNIAYFNIAILPMLCSSNKTLKEQYQKGASIK